MDEEVREPLEYQRNADEILDKQLLSAAEIEFRGYYNMWRLVLIHDGEEVRKRCLVEFIRYYNDNFEAVNSSLLITTALATVFVGEEAAIGEYNKVCYAIRKLL
jgi:hypothetical protein